MYLNFKSSSYTCPQIKEDKEKDNREDTTKKAKESSNKPECKNPEDKEEKKDKNEKDKNLGIREFVRQLNYDAFMHRQGEGKSILPKEYFLNVLLGRLKMVELNGYNKSLRQLNMEEDKLL